ncbi:MAG: ABC transporter permease [Clostridia bacterium]|nr:ABC transporter permease [Clostridia bacterium]
MNKRKSILDNRFVPILFSIVLGFLVGAVFLAVMGLSVGTAYGRLLNSVTSLKGFSYVVVYAVPYIVAGLSVAFSFRTGVFNIGAEGQFVVGSMAAAVVGILFPDLPKPILIPFCFLAAMFFGALWGIVVAVLKIKWGINEVLSMIMFNWIAFYLSNFVAGIPAIHSDGSAEATKNISANASMLLPKDFIKSVGLCPTANWGILVAIAIMIIVWLVIDKTTLGYELKSVGANRFAAEYGGINVNRSILTALAISGILSGLAGALQLMGMGNRISVFTSQEGFGFAGIVVALIGVSNPFGVFAAGLFYGALIYGGSKLNLVGAPTQLINVIVGTVVFFIAISSIFQFKGLRRRLQSKKEGKKA